jgi:hypothetical protein
VGKEAGHGLKAMKRDVELKGSLFQAFPLEIAELVLDALQRRNNPGAVIGR